MTTITGSRTVIVFLKGYGERETWAMRNYQVTRSGGVCLNKPIGIVLEDWIKFLLIEISVRLEVIRRATQGGWNGPRILEKLRNAWLVKPSSASAGWSRIATAGLPIS